VDLRIAGIRPRVVTVPIKRTVVARIGHYSHMWFVLVDIATDDGPSGLD
jgi:hypothetical protein